MAESVEVKVRIPAELHDRFQRIVPIYGAMAWMMRTTIEEFCEHMEGLPSLREQVIASVQRATRSGM